MTVEISEAYKTAVEETPIESVGALREVAATVLGPFYVPEDDRKLEAYFRMEAAQLVETRFTPGGDVAPTLADLARMNVPLAALGDDWPSIDERKAAAVGFPGVIIHPTDLARDPGALPVFEEVARRLRLPPENIWFVGTDLDRDIASAAAAGMRTIWIDDGGSHAPRLTELPDATVGSFGAIRDVLAEPYTRGLLALRYIMRTSLDWRPGFSIGASDSFDADDADAVGPHEQL